MDEDGGVASGQRMDVDVEGYRETNGLVNEGMHFLGLSFLNERPGKKKKKARDSCVNTEEFRRAFGIL